MKEEIRPLYLELQGYLKQLSKNVNNIIKTEETWNNYHSVIDELNSLTGEDYNKFKLKINYINSNSFGNPYNYVNSDNFRFQLGGLIQKIYGSYFQDEKNPTDDSTSPQNIQPANVINNVQSQSQSQSIKLEIAVEITEIIARKISDYEEGSKERTFLEQIKDGLKEGKNVVELVNLILSTGINIGLTMPVILQLLSK